MSLNYNGHQIPKFHKSPECRWCPECGLSIDRRSSCRHWREQHQGPQEQFLENDPQLENKSIDKVRINNDEIQFRLVEKSISTPQEKKRWIAIQEICGSTAFLNFVTNSTDLTREQSEISILEGPVVTRYLSEMINFKSQYQISDNIDCTLCGFPTAASMAHVWIHRDVPCVPHGFCEECVINYKTQNPRLNDSYDTILDLTKCPNCNGKSGTSVPASSAATFFYF